MKNKRYPTAFVFGASLAAALSGAALRTLAYFLIYDAEVGYFRTGFFSTLLYIYPIAAALALAVLLTLRIPKNCAPGDFVIAPGSARAAAGIEIAAAAALLALTIFDIATALRVGENMSYVCAATTLISCLYLAPRMKQPALRALGGMALVVRALQTVCTGVSGGVCSAARNCVMAPRAHRPRVSERKNGENASTACTAAAATAPVTSEPPREKVRMEPSGREP